MRTGKYPFGQGNMEVPGDFEMGTFSSGRGEVTL